MLQNLLESCMSTTDSFRSCLSGVGQVQTYPHDKPQIGVYPKTSNKWNFT